MLYAQVPSGETAQLEDEDWFETMSDALYDEDHPYHRLALALTRAYRDVVEGTTQILH